MYSLCIARSALHVTASKQVDGVCPPTPAGLAVWQPPPLTPGPRHAALCYELLFSIQGSAGIQSGALALLRVGKVPAWLSWLWVVGSEHRQLSGGDRQLAGS